MWKEIHFTEAEFGGMRDVAEAMAYSDTKKSVTKYANMIKGFVKSMASLRPMLHLTNQFEIAAVSKQINVNLKLGYTEVSYIVYINELQDFTA